MKRILFILALVSIVSTLLCIEVGGHITQNTTWTPDINPYIITSFLYVDAGVTLTILPGTQIRCMGANKDNINNFMWSSNNQPIAKMIIVNGAINAVGTPDLPISFDKQQVDSSYRWGGIYIAPNSPLSHFEYCEFNNSFFCDFIPGEWSLAAIHFENGLIQVSNCKFQNNYIALGSGNQNMDIIVYKCEFISNDTYPTPFAHPTAIAIGAAASPVPSVNFSLIIARCYFSGSSYFVYPGYYSDILFLYNKLENYVSKKDQNEMTRNEFGSLSSYGNTTINGSGGWVCYSSTTTDTVFARRNVMIKPENANPGNSPLILGASGFGTNYVSDNYLSGCVQVKTTMSNATTSNIYNNTIENNYPGAVLEFATMNPENQGGQVRFYNNLVSYNGDYQYQLIVKTTETSPFIYNNTFLYFSILFRTIGYSDMVLENNIIPCTQWSSGGVSQEHHPLLINNCLSMPLIDPWSLLDGGGNIVADPMFADTLNGDYSLSAGSPCIDAGAYRPDLPQFDLRYHKRIAPGISNGPRSIDIGAYEYNSVYIGGINGYVYDSVSGLPVDCVKIEIFGKLPEFSDTLGCFQYPSGTGNYTVKVSRWDYDDLIIPNVQVTQGDDTILNIPLVRTNVANDDNTQSPEPTDFGLANYPNPFNPTTTISFIAPQAGTTKLSVFNIKGQRVNMLCNGLLSKGHHSIIWNGLDEKGTAVSSGVYFVRVEMNGMSQTHKMILMK